MFFLDDRYHLSVLSPQKEEYQDAEGVTILFLIEGEVSIEKIGERQKLNEGSILIFNRGEGFRIQPLSKIPPVLIKVTISNLYFVAKFPQFYSTRFHSYLDEREASKKASINSLRNYLAELVLVTSSVKEEKKIQLSMLINKIMLLLVQQFKTRSEFDHYEIYHHKVVEVIVYLEKHFKEKITLQSVADVFYMTGPSLSKLFKEETGMNFLTYLNRLRVHNSLKDIMYTRKSIDEIAEANGFNNSKTYRKQFKELMNDSPTNYRKTFQLDSKEKPVIHEEEMERAISEDILVKLYGYIKTNHEEVEVPNKIISKKTIRSKKTGTGYQSGEHIIHITCLEDILNVRTREKIIASQKDIGIDYLGVQNLIDNNNNLSIFWSESKKNIRDVEKLADIFSFLEENNIGLFYTIKISEVDEKKVEIFKVFLEFIRRSKSRNNLQKLKINCQFENIETNNSYNQFHSLKRAIQAIYAGVQFGVELPFDVLDINNNLATTYQRKIAKESDFLSFQAKPNQELYYQQDDFLHIEEYQKFIQERCKNLKELIQSWQCTMPIYLTEWNVLEGRNQNTKASFFREGMILQEIVNLDKEIAGYGFWLDNQTYEIAEERDIRKHDGLVLFHQHFEKNPIYFTLSLLKRLLGEVVSSRGEFILTRNDNNYQLLMWNTTYFSPELSLDKDFLSKQLASFQLSLPDLKNGYYQVRQIDLNSEHGSINHSYEKVKSVFLLEDTDYQYLAETTQPLVQVYDLQVTEGARLTISIEPNGVALVEFTCMR